MRYANETLQQAADHIVHTVLAPNDGSGGLVAIDRDGNVSMPFNSQGMYRGVVSAQANAETFIF